MRPATATTVLRGSAIQRCLTGALLLCDPQTPTGVIAGHQARPPSWLVRLLGSRLLAQGALEYAYPGRTVALGGAAVDTAHAASMIAMAVLRPAYRRSALASAIEASVSAALTASLVRQLP
jgi:hypothetical protein